METNKFVTISHNIDTNIARLEDGYAKETHPEWRSESRAAYLTNYLQLMIYKYNPSVICIQECRSFINKAGEKVDSITPLVDLFEANGYNALVCPYNSSNLAFSYITAYRKDLSLVSTSKKYFTMTPHQETDHSQSIDLVKQHNFGEVWERCTFITELTDGVDTFVVFNVNLAISLSARLAASDLLKEWSNEYSDKKVLIIGDFNAFPDWGGDKQIERLLTDSQLNTCPKLLLASTEEEINSSFFSFPYDFGKDEQRLGLAPVLSKMDVDKRRDKIWETFETECSALGGKLDWLFYFGFDACKLLLYPTPTAGPLPDYSESSVKQYILSHKHQPAFASDHQPIIGILEY